MYVLCIHYVKKISKMFYKTSHSCALFQQNKPRFKTPRYVELYLVVDNTEVCVNTYFKQ